MDRPLILVVEDDLLLQFALGEMLTEAGFEPILASDGNEAIEQLRADAGRFRAVVTDIQLGGNVNGWAVARQARQLVAYMPIVYITGNSAQQWVYDGVPNSILMQKPFAFEQLKMAVFDSINVGDVSRSAMRRM